MSPELIAIIGAAIALAAILLGQHAMRRDITTCGSGWRGLKGRCRC